MNEPILIVEDNPLNLKLAKIALEVEGFEVQFLVKYNGEENTIPLKNRFKNMPRSTQVKLNDIYFAFEFNSKFTKYSLQNVFRQSINFSTRRISFIYQYESLFIVNSSISTYKSF